MSINKFPAVVFFYFILFLHFKNIHTEFYKCFFLLKISK